MGESLSSLIPEITFYLKRVIPRGDQEADELHRLVTRLEKHGTRRKPVGSAVEQT